MFSKPNQLHASLLHRLTLSQICTDIRNTNITAKYAINKSFAIHLKKNLISVIIRLPQKNRKFEAETCFVIIIKQTKKVSCFLFIILHMFHLIFSIYFLIYESFVSIIFVQWVHLKLKSRKKIIKLHNLK